MTIEEILTRFRKVLVVGLSPNESRPSHHIAQYLIDAGFEVSGVRPGGHKEILGCPVYARVADAPPPLEIVDVFRASENIPDLVNELLPLKPKVLWLQEGVSHPEAEARARAAGIKVVADRCILKDHLRYGRR